MFRDNALNRLLIMYSVAIPMAIMLGYLVASADGFFSYALIAMMMLVFTLPLVLKFHHEMTIITWNSSLIVFFLPGQPNAGYVFAGICLIIGIVSYTLTKKEPFIHVPEFSRPLILLFLIVIGTAVISGGLGGRSLGSDQFGAKRYLGVIGPVVGYFAMTSRRIKPDHAQLLASLYFLSGVLIAGSDIAYALGPSFYFLFALFPVEQAFLQAVQETFTRITGIAWASTSILYFLMLRYGAKGILDLRYAWRLLLFAALFGVSMFGGYRTAVIVVAIIFFIQFIAEGLLRSRLLPVMLAGAAFAIVLTFAFSRELPLSFQRSLSFIPFIDIDPVARQDAMGTLDWRFQMWKIVIPDIPKYLLLGKGFAYSGTDYMLTSEAIRQGYYGSYEATLVSGNYHNGILTLIIPFGIFGTIAFAWLMFAGTRILFRNYRCSAPEIRNINTFLFAFFLGRSIFYLTLYGQFDLDFMVFVGVVALSVSLNGGIRKPSDLKQRKPEPADATVTPATA